MWVWEARKGTVGESLSSSVARREGRVRGFEVVDAIVLVW
jgi:hypothetical protein